MNGRADGRLDGWLSARGADVINGGTGGCTETGLGENIHVTCSSAGTRLGNEPDFRLNFYANRKT